MTSKTARKSFASKITALALTSAMFSLTFTSFAHAGDTLPYTGESAKGTNQPYQHGYASSHILDWTPQSDPYSDLLRARVPLQQRNQAFAPTQANPKLNPNTQNFTLSGDYGNSFFDSYSYTNEFSEYLFNYWQYTDFYGYWHGMPTAGVPREMYDPNKDWTEKWFEFGILNIPNPAYTNAAHKNGVRSIACIFFSDNDRGPQTYKQMLVQDENGDFPVAKKLVEMAHYYGYDGYFINQEEASKGVAPADIPLYKQFLKYLKDQGMYVQWYDSTVNDTGAIDYQNEFNAVNSPFVKDSQYGQISDSIFLNYWWDKEKLKKSSEHAKNLGLDPLQTVFAGIEGGNGDFGRWKQKYDLRLNLDDQGQPMNSIATLGADFTHNALDEELGGEDRNLRANDDYQWMTFVRDRAWWSGPNLDPSHAERNADADLADVKASGANWDGMAAYIAERSVINGSSFSTSFNTGHGMQYYVKGAVSNPKEWSNINIQDIPVTWQWWLETKGSKLNVDFDYGPQYTAGPRYTYQSIGAYNGGNSLVVNGKLDADNFLHLYKTDLAVKSGSKLSLTYNKPSADDSSAVSVGLIFKDQPNQIVYVPVPDTGKQTSGWATRELDLGAYQGRELASIGLKFANGGHSISNYQVNIGQLRITDGTTSAPSAPTGFHVTKALTGTNEMYVAWNLADYKQVKQYNLYENGVYVGGIYDSAYYIKKLTQRKGELSLTAVGADGTESAPAKVSYNLDAGVSNISVETKKNGHAFVTWVQPKDAAGDIKLTLKTEYTDQPFTKSWTVKGKSQSAQLTGLPLNGDTYSLDISIGDGQPVTYRGKLADYEIEPYAKENVSVNGNTYTLALPTMKDWHYIYVYEDGVPKEFGVTYVQRKFPYIVRGRTKLSDLTFTANSSTSSLKLVIEDYTGNQATTILR
ncbi:endo-beta-N-acetylglucosaminidase [Paenibacillus sp. JX-17]|uniref:Endo-beta-N-acetylglucosaminidase n=1 Tax=Paenibacillus lacisoli TaxID=3064525 RepID=A0ABT9CHW8_9BACL|nr:endo-beta-N-acetylglucosaminidase [Paenibacillus sp. JX-17]MDO7908168.1 endo-beta-N-acetylglucosaminidase [Paenibacillus sp. JX-17]